MNRTSTLLFSGLLGLLPCIAKAQPCTGPYATGQAQVPAGNWGPAVVPSATTLTATIQTELGSTSANVGGTAWQYMFVGGAVTGPNVPPGTTITAITPGTPATITLSQAATNTGTTTHSIEFIWNTNTPPTSNGPPTGIACSTCPSLFTVDICANQWTQMYMCVGNMYTISLCTSTSPFNSVITITNANNPSPTAYAYDDDGCGTTNGLSELTFVPTVNQVYRIRITEDPCTMNASLCGTLQISCSPVPPPPPNDDPCNAIQLNGGTSCSMDFGSTAWATQTGGMSPPNCGSFAGSDVWFSAVVPASGNLVVETELASAPDLAMALYTATACNGTFTQVACNDDASAGVLEPYLLLSGLPPGQTVYIRVWPKGGPANTGTFEICAYEPIPPTNDNPCNAAVLPVGAACSPNTYTTVYATPISGMTLSPATPSCGTPVAGGDVWFQVTMPPTGSMTVASQAGSLTDMAMAVYQLTAGTICSGTLTQVLCNDNMAPGQMPGTVINGTAGNVYYVRMWNKTTASGTFQICAYQNVPPANDNPCGALPLTVRYGCLYDSYSNANATNTTASPAPPGTVSVPNPTCGTPTNDVWFTAVVPPTGILEFSTDDGQMTDAAMAVYTATGSCAGNNLSLTQVACVTAGSTHAAAMPATQVPGLPPGQTVYVRVWRTSGADGSFLLCARRTDSPPGACDFVLTMYDSAGDGWNGSTVEVCVIPVVGTPTCTPYTVPGAGAEIVFGAAVGSVITITYTAAGGFQNEISYRLRTPDGGLLFSSGSPPTVGVAHVFTVDSDCNIPPYPQEDCVGAMDICTPGTYGGNPNNTGAVADLHAGNHGCLLGDERRGYWYRIHVAQSGTLAFTITPTANQDYDWAVWGPYTPLVVCPPQMPPIRCSWSAIQGATGLSFTDTDLSEGAAGNGWVRYIDALAGQTYLLYVDNWTGGGVAFNMTFPGQMTADIDCVVLPVELFGLEAMPGPGSVDLVWRTAQEMNSSHFVVERSDDGLRFAPIGVVPAAGTSHTPREYRFPDADPLAGMNYYRLKQVDQSEDWTYSNTVSALFRDGAQAAVVPNPTRDAADLVFVQTTREPLLARITDGGGRELLRFRVPDGVRRVAMPVEGLDAGSYQVEVITTDGLPHSVARLVKQ
jgi:hypothetical protein